VGGLSTRLAQGGPRALRRPVRGSQVPHAACTCAGRVVPFDAILMSILIEERRSARELSRRLEELERRLTGGLPECHGGS